MTGWYNPLCNPKQPGSFFIAQVTIWKETFLTKNRFYFDFKGGHTEMGLVGRIDFKDPSLSLPTSQITGANNKTHSIKSGFSVHGITSGNLTGSMCFLAYSKLMCKKAVKSIYSLLLKLFISQLETTSLSADLTMFPWFSCPLPGNLPTTSQLPRCLNNPLMLRGHEKFSPENPMVQ